MEIKKYLPNIVEPKMYQFWLNEKFFHSEPNEKPAYTIVIPPPNVTGILHMGHMLNNSIQDVLVRRARMKGFNACWIPGTDHASIATEAKVVNKLKEEGVSKFDIGREQFLQHAWDWKTKYGDTILKQLQKLGCSCDWDRTRFTMEPKLSEAVIKVFVQLHQKGLIYRGYKMINWDPEAKTNISDEEVIHKEQNGKLYYLKYQLENSQEYLSVATTRPETIFGDVAVCVNPNDERYQALIGKMVMVPIVNRLVPIISDDYVDIEFGTGCLKITPAHDINDYNIGQKHQLDIIDSFDNDGKLNQNGLHYEGKDRFVVRKEIAKELEEKNLLIKWENHLNKVGTSERTGAVIEPKLSVQWFLKMSEMAKPALDAVMGGEIQFFPDKFKNTYRHWMENVHDWNISRQLWWGQQIPAYYYGNSENEYVVAESKDEALIIAKKQSNYDQLTLEHLKQDDDVLDTWFSSWLWPMSVFDGIIEPSNQDFNYYYPTADLVTGPDIIFFWVARMVMAGQSFQKQIPFKNVYFTGIVRDKQGRKMSKQLGNSPDPIELIEKYGADSVRTGVMLSSAAGNDLLFDEDLMVQGRNFATKIWKSFQLLQSWTPQEDLPTVEQKKQEKEAILWMTERIKQASIEVDDHFSKFRISDALHTLYKLIWDDYCSWYLEIVKPPFGEKIHAKTYQSTVAIFEDLLKLLHPFMPFITEEIWQNIEKRNSNNALIITQQSNYNSFQQDIIQDFDLTKEMVSAIRNYRKEKNISPKEAIQVYCSATEMQIKNHATFSKLCHIDEFYFDSIDTISSPFYTVLVKNIQLAIPMSQNIDIEKELQKMNEEILYLKGFLQSIDKKLSNEKFVNGAPVAVIDLEKKKQKDAMEKIEILDKKMKSISQ